MSNSEDKVVKADLNEFQELLGIGTNTATIEEDSAPSDIPDPSTDTSTSTSPSTSADTIEEKTEEPELEEKVESEKEPIVEEKVEETSELDKRYEALLAEHSALSERMLSGKPVVEKPPEGVDADTWANFKKFQNGDTSTSSNELVKDAIDTIQFINSDEDWEGHLKDRESFNKLLNTVYLAARDASVSISLQKMPEIASYQNEFAFQSRAITEKFWADNPDLNNPVWHKITGAKANEIEQLHPSWGVQEVCDELGKILGPMVQVHKATGGTMPVAQENKESSKPALPGSSSSIKPGKVEDSLQDEIMKTMQIGMHELS